MRHATTWDGEQVAGVAGSRPRRSSPLGLNPVSGLGRHRPVGEGEGRAGRPGPGTPGPRSRDEQRATARPWSSRETTQPGPPGQQRSHWRSPSPGTQDPPSVSHRPGQVLSQAPSRPAPAPSLQSILPQLLAIHTLALHSHRLSAPLRVPRNSPPNTCHFPTPASLGPSSKVSESYLDLPNFPPPRPPVQNQHTSPRSSSRN